MVEGATPRRDDEFETMWAEADVRQRERLRDNEFATIGEELGDASWEARGIVEQREREEREAQAFREGVRAYEALPETDHERDAAHDSGEDTWRELFR